MSWRTVVITGCAKLDYKMDYLVIRKSEGTSRVHIGEIGVLIVESTAVSLTTILLCELTKKKVKTIFCDEHHNPQSELISHYGSHDTSGKIKKQVSWDVANKKSIWTEIVSDKIRKQAVLLDKLGFVDQSKMLKSYLQELMFGDVSNREGHAAKVYFNALFGKDFTRSEDIAVNAALNYGYSIILSSFNKEIVSCGYVTQLGLCHDNMFNPYNLGSDLMEPFRILVDQKVYSMKLDCFTHDEKMELVALLHSEVRISGQRQYLTNAIKIYTNSIFEALNDKDPSLIRFYGNEL